MAGDSKLDLGLVDALLVNTLLKGLPASVDFADEEQIGWLNLNACPAGHWHAGYCNPATGLIRGDLEAVGDSPQAALMGLQILIAKNS